jgi:hypothetical protein
VTLTPLGQESPSGSFDTSANEEDLMMRSIAIAGVFASILVGVVLACTGGDHAPAERQPGLPAPATVTPESCYVWDCVRRYDGGGTIVGVYANATECRADCNCTTFTCFDGGGGPDYFCQRDPC